MEIRAKQVPPSPQIYEDSIVLQSVFTNARELLEQSARSSLKMKIRVGKGEGRGKSKGKSPRRKPGRPKKAVVSDDDDSDTNEQQQAPSEEVSCVVTHRFLPCPGAGDETRDEAWDELGDCPSSSSPSVCSCARR
ncbi:Transcription activator BRG1 [Branchiostoma belcheri]|nr:Transcription activator BRG1 [Branchiostoma belcheri]